MQVKYALNWKIFVLLLCDIYQQYQRFLDTRSNTSYKKLVKYFHPDVIISKGLPEEFIEFASGRFREIQESYEKIRQERNF